MLLNYQFPLFDSFLRGSLSPFGKENHADNNFKQRLQEQITISATDEGNFQLQFVKPNHPKQEYYRRALLSETFNYCNEMLTELTAETSHNIRAYYRETILDRHLTTCLQQLGELINAKKLTYQQLIQPTDNLTVEDVTNAYCLHILKVCLAKAYLEIQDALADTVIYRLDEAELYSTYLHELAPIHTFLRKNMAKAPASTPATTPTRNYEEKPLVESKVAAPSLENNIEVLTTKEAAAILKVSVKTIIRKLESNEIKGSKLGRQWRIDKEWFENYIQTLTR